jgi:hypothetical protein
MMQQCGSLSLPLVAWDQFLFLIAAGVHQLQYDGWLTYYFISPLTYWKLAHSINDQVC